MLDNNITLFSVENINLNTVKQNQALILTGCNALLCPGDLLYSELDDLNFCSLTSNNYGFGRVDIELCFENHFVNPYMSFYASCFSIRTDLIQCIKVNGNPNQECFTKVNKNNRVVLGITYFFRSAIERDAILNCKLFCIEGFVAMNTKTNVYGIMCRLNCTDENWSIIDANTYRITTGVSIRNLIH